MTRPSSAVADASGRHRAARHEPSPGRMPAVPPSGTVSRAPSRNPTTSRGSGGRPLRAAASQSSPTLARGPLDSTTRPTVRTTRPQSGSGSVRKTMSR